MMIGDLLYYTQKYSQSLFLKNDDEELTYQEAEIKVSRIASSLAEFSSHFLEKSFHKEKTRKPFTIALLLQPGINYVLIILAAYQLKRLKNSEQFWKGISNPVKDFRVFPLNPHKPKEVLKQEMKRAGVDVLIHDQNSIDRYHPTLLFEELCSIDKLLTSAKPTLPPSEGMRGDNSCDQEPFIYLSTSGSSGKSKVAVFSWDSWMRSADSGDHFFPFRQGDRWLHLLPFYHVSGMAIVFRALLHGATIVFTDRHQKNWEDILTPYQITHISLVPAQLQSHLNRMKALKRSPSLKMVLVGGGPIPESLHPHLHPHSSLRPTYGLTESVAHVAIFDGEGKKDFPLQILHPRQVQVRDGEILIHKDILFLGYLGEDGQVVEPWDDQGWFPTGDLGEIMGKEKNYLVVRGRKDRQFISGGENIHPEEIEKAILSYIPSPGSSFQIFRVCVFPIPDERWGMIPAVALDGKGDIPLLPLREYLTHHLEKYKIPNQFFLLPPSLFRSGIKLSYQMVQDTYQRGKLISINSKGLRNEQL